MGEIVYRLIQGKRTVLQSRLFSLSCFIYLFGVIKQKFQ